MAEPTPQPVPPPAERGGYRFVLSARWLRYIALAIVAAVACGFLANWQDHRRAARDAEIERIETNYHGAARPLPEVLPDRTAPLPVDAEWAKVAVTGSYDPGATVLARNRSLQNQAGFYVVVPLVLDSGDTIAVVRGWVPTTSEGSAPAREAIPAPPAGEVDVEMWLRPRQDASGDSNPPGLIRAIDPDAIPGMDSPVTEAYGQLSAEDPAPADDGLTPLPPPSTDPGSHLSYTFQWIVFGIMILAGVVYAARREKRALDAARSEQAAEAAPTEYVVVDKAALARGGRRSAGASTGGGRYGGGRTTRPGRADPRSPQSSRSKQSSRSPQRQRTEEELEDALLDSQGY